MQSNKTCIFLDCNQNKTCLCQGFNQKHQRSQPICQHFYDQMFEIQPDFLSELKEYKEGQKIYNYKKDKLNKVCYLHNDLQEKFIQFINQDILIQKFQLLLDLLEKDKKIIRFFTQYLVQISNAFFSSYELKQGTESISKLLKLFKIFEFSDAIKNRDYIIKNIQRLSECIVQIDKDKITQFNNQQKMIDVVCQGFQVINFRQNFQTLEKKQLIVIYEHVIDQIFKFNQENNQLIYQYYQFIWNYCLFDQEIVKRFNEQNHLKMTTINYIHQFTQLSLQLQEIIIGFLISVYKQDIFFTNHKNYTQFINKLFQNKDIYHKHIQYELENINRQYEL